MSHASSNDLTLGTRASGALRDIDLDDARDALRRAQTALSALGYSVGEHGDPADGIDGIWGKRTQAAVLQFQLDQALPRTGQLDPDTVTALFESEFAACQNAYPSATDDDETLRHEAEHVVTASLHDSITDVLDELEPTDPSDETLQ